MGRRRWGQWGPRLAGGAAFVAALGVGFLPPASSAPGPNAAGRLSFPSSIGGYSYFTGDIAASPAGPAVALFQHGFGVEFLDFPQAVVVGAEGRSYRRVGVAENRGSPQAQGDPGPMLLSPDGAFVAVGTNDTSAPDLAIVDLTTGRTRDLPVPGGHSVVPLAWSADSSRLAYVSAEEATSPASGVEDGGALGLLEPQTGEAHLVPGIRAQAAAFSPDGSELAVQVFTGGKLSNNEPWTGPTTPSTTTPGAATQVKVLGRDDRVLRELGLPAGHSLDGPNAWSLDGSLLATRPGAWGCLQAAGAWDQTKQQACEEQRLATGFVDATGRGAPAPGPLLGGVAGTSGVLGWTAAREMLVLDDVPGPVESIDDSKAVTAEEVGGRWLTAVSLDSGASRRVSAVPYDDNYGIGSFQVASAQVPGLKVLDAAQVDRGRWPAPLRVGAAGLFAGLVLLVTKRVLSARSSR